MVARSRPTTTVGTPIHLEKIKEGIPPILYIDPFNTQGQRIWPRNQPPTTLVRRATRLYRGSEEEATKKVGGRSVAAVVAAASKVVGRDWEVVEWGKKIRVSCFVKKEIDVEHWMMIRWLKIYEIFRMLI